MTRELSLEEFLARNRIDDTTWKNANVEWSTLLAIATDHEAQLEQLGESAALFAKAIQKFEKVHSVRWRVKDTEHLLEKIVRKRAEGNSKYEDISPSNYFERVTDLVGIRALHLFKDDCLSIVVDLKNLCPSIETPVVYIRTGDRAELNKRFAEEHFEIKDHPAGYRSVHYVFESRPLSRKIVTEVQVRTIFEEGWSEIDHTVRYPNFSNNELVAYFLAIFNRMAGSADEMGEFVRGLTTTIENLEQEIAAAREEKEATLLDMDHALSQLESVREQDKASKESIAKLKAEVAKLKEGSQTGMSPIYTTASGSFGEFIRSLVEAQKMVQAVTSPTAAEQAKRGNPPKN